MTSSIDTINSIAQTLDEMADDVPALADLAERLGQATERLDREMSTLQMQIRQRPEDGLPRYLSEIARIVEREVRNTRGMMYPRDEREMQRVYEDYLRYSARQKPFNPITISGG